LLSAGIAVAKLAGLGAVMLLVGARFVPWLLLRVARLRSRELFTLTVLVIAMAVATAGYLAFGASMALGAFLAGMVVGQSKLSHQAAADALPMRDAFAVLFFVSVGMLFDWRTILNEPWLVLGTTLVVLVVKPLIAILIVVAGRHSLRTGLVVAGGLAQIGEFSFIVAEAAKGLGIMPGEGHHAIVAAAIISISMNPWLFGRFMAIEGWVERRPQLRDWLYRRSSAYGAATGPRTDTSSHGAPQVIIVGYGPVGRSIEHRVAEFHLDHIVIDMNVDTVLALQKANKQALFGDATHAEILSKAGVKTAKYLVVTMPEAALAHSIVTVARSINPEIKVLVRARYLNEADMLEQCGPDAICYDEAEAATALSMLLRAHARSDGYNPRAPAVRT
jgi:CPA2 family monovalent cation:H+ antiporter-2